MASPSPSPYPTPPSSPPHRRFPRRRRAALVTAVAVAVVALAASLVVALRPDDRSTAQHTTPQPPAAGTRSPSPRKASSTPPTRKPKQPTATPTATRRPASEPTAPARPSVKATPRPASASAPLAGRIRPDVTYEGVATFYGTGNGDGGACMYGPTSDVMTAAMNQTDYETSKACGAYIRVRASNGASVTVRITNECPLPCAPGQLDLSAQAFAKLAAPSAGRIPITWSLLSPGTSGKISIRYKTGSSRYWCGIQAVGHRNPLARLEVRDGTSWRRLPRTEYNYFLAEQGGGCGGEIRLTDIHGESLTVKGLAIRPDALQPTGVQFAAH